MMRAKYVIIGILLEPRSILSKFREGYVTPALASVSRLRLVAGDRRAICPALLGQLAV
jgi:hypothetical protein